MSKVLIEENTMTNIANTIRNKSNTIDPIYPSEMSTMINNLSMVKIDGNTINSELNLYSTNTICSIELEKGIFSGINIAYVTNPFNSFKDFVFLYAQDTGSTIYYSYAIYNSSKQKYNIYYNNISSPFSSSSSEKLCYDSKTNQLYIYANNGNWDTTSGSIANAIYKLNINNNTWTKYLILANDNDGISNNKYSFVYNDYLYFATSANFYKVYLQESATPLVPTQMNIVTSNTGYYYLSPLALIDNKIYISASNNNSIQCGILIYNIDTNNWVYHSASRPAGNLHSISVDKNGQIIGNFYESTSSTTNIYPYLLNPSMENSSWTQLSGISFTSSMGFIKTLNQNNIFILSNKKIGNCDKIYMLKDGAWNSILNTTMLNNIWNNFFTTSDNILTIIPMYSNQAGQYYIIYGKNDGGTYFKSYFKVNNENKLETYSPYYKIESI